LFRLRGFVQRWLLRIRRPVTLGVRVLPTDGAGNVLLVRHRYGGDRWVLPGGGVRRNEPFHTAARRELLEETCLEAESLRLIGLFINRAETRTDHVAVFAAKMRPFPPAPASDEIADCAWHAIAAPGGELSPGTSRRLQEYRSGALPAFGEW
jgi:8-oxo-dGTP pyrophosphatase MutT (NUDIX family)